MLFYTYNSGNRNIEHSGMDLFRPWAGFDYQLGPEVVHTWIFQGQKL